MAFVTFDLALSRDDGSLMHADRTAEAHTVPPPKIGAVNNMTMRSSEQIDQSEQGFWHRPPITVDFLPLRKDGRSFNPPLGRNNLSPQAETSALPDPTSSHLAGDVTQRGGAAGRKSSVPHLDPTSSACLCT